ncbi:hypothetical protein SK224_16455 [Microbacterium sp. BG28]|uniref:hypothetical protein n=1 Tax=Microbacterium sp. BG28 TaxID=3097356 RepID=UPI002A599611|nr:hypothetical protein [Microbacterium sp. BG28]MDY0830728.1 hypothetical protein [Microbacterium sp. BG28]
MALTRSLPTLAADGLTATQWRQIQAGMVARSAAGVPRTGILPAHYDPLVTGKASMGFNIAPFVAALSRLPGMVEFLANPELADFSPAEYVAPNANRRIDLIWVRSRFTDATDPSNQPVFGITLGDPSGTPTEPATIPAGAEILASVETPSTATTTQSSGVVITPRHRFTALEDGIVALRSQTEANAWAPADGARAYRIDKKAGYRRGNGAWIPDRAVFFANRGSAQSLSPAGWWVVASAFAAPAVNDLGTWTGENGTLQVQHAGIYRVGGFVKLADPSNPMSMQITRNSGAPDAGVVVESFLNSPSSSLNAGALVSLAAGDTLRLLVFNSTATTVAAAQLSLELVTLT